MTRMVLVSSLCASLLLSFGAFGIARSDVAPNEPPPRGAAANEPAAIAPEFLLESTKGERVSLHAPRAGRVATALVFLVEECPVSKIDAPKVGRLAKEYADQGVVFLVVDSTPGTDAKKAAAFGAANGIAAPLLLDPMQATAKHFEVKNAATTLLLDRDFKTVYRGALDDQCEGGTPKARAANDWLVEAIEAVIGEEADPSRPATEAAGMALGGDVPFEPTFNEHVGAIVYKHCADCHRPGQVGPMSLLDYDDVKGYAPQIAEVIGNGRMPPWHADPRYGNFENERRLTDTEKAILERWVDRGAKQGDPKKKPKAPVFKDDGWGMGKPDLIVELPEPQKIPAEGVVDYRYVYNVDPKLKEEKWVQSVEIRPTAQEATHHVLAFYIPPGMGPAHLLGGLRDGSIIGQGYFAVQVPGCRPNLYPEGAGKKIEPGGTFIFQLHYTPNGKATTDRTRMGLRFCKSKPKQEVLTCGVFARDIRIPPNDAHAVATSTHTFKKPVRILSMFPHMHSRGAAFRFERISGQDDDEQRTILCDVPRYDFNWQNFYLPSGPLQFAAGDRMFCTAVYDNSKGNPFNPDPNKFVTWGDQTYEEMMIGYLDFVEEE